MTTRSTRLLLAGIAVFLGALAPFVGSQHVATPRPVDFRELANAVVEERDHVTARELAVWIHDRKPGLRVLDVRSKEEFDAYHVPGAEHMPLELLVATKFRPTDTLVLFSEGGSHAAQGWVFLRALGYEHVFFVRGGLNEWLDEQGEVGVRIGSRAVRRGC
jgi:rhodanese-related sulfurtransferase